MQTDVTENTPILQIGCKMEVLCEGETPPLHIKEPIKLYRREQGETRCGGTPALTPSTGPLGGAVPLYMY